MVLAIPRSALHPDAALRLGFRIQRSPGKKGLEKIHYSIPPSRSGFHSYGVWLRLVFRFLVGACLPQLRRRLAKRVLAAEVQGYDK